MTGETETPPKGWSPDGSGLGLAFCIEEWDRLLGRCPQCGGYLWWQEHECHFSEVTGEEWCSESIGCNACKGVYIPYAGWDWEDDSN